MAPIRVGIIGLSKSGWAPYAHLPYLKESPDYDVVAICNSSVESSKAAIKLYDLPESTKAYGNPEDLAQDSNIDLVVCTVRVDRHLPTIGPSLKAGKDVVVEWPLGKSAAEARELLRLKKEGGVKYAVVGLQGRQAPIVKKLKELVNGGRIGRVLHSTYSSQSMLSANSVTQGHEMLGQKEIGANLLTILFGHQIDYVQQVLGYGFSSHHSVLANRRPHVKLVDKEKKVLSDFTKDTDDIIYFIGTLKNDIPLSFSLRAGGAFKDTPELDWRIYGEEGEIRVTSSSGFLSVGTDDMKIEVHDFQKDSVEQMEIPADELDKLGRPAQNVARIYRALAAGEVNCSFEDAVQGHELIEKLYKENGYTEA